MNSVHHALILIHYLTSLKGGGTSTSQDGDRREKIKDIFRRDNHSLCCTVRNCCICRQLWKNAAEGIQVGIV